MMSTTHLTYLAHVTEDPRSSIWYHYVKRTVARIGRTVHILLSLVQFSDRAGTHRAVPLALEHQCDGK